MEYDVLLINLETFRTMTADHYRLVEMKVPEGWTQVDSLSKEELIEAARRAIERARN